MTNKQTKVNKVEAPIKAEDILIKNVEVKTKNQHLDGKDNPREYLTVTYDNLTNTNATINIQTEWNQDEAKFGFYEACWSIFDVDMKSCIARALSWDIDYAFEMEALEIKQNDVVTTALDD